MANGTRIDTGRTELTRRGRLLSEIVRNRTIYLMLIPGLIFVIAIRYLPMYGLVVSFKDYNPFKGIWQSPWVGFKQFRLAFGSPLFWMSVWNTVIISFFKWLIGMPAPMILAILIDQVRARSYRKVVQTISYFPHFISWVVIGGFAYTFFGSDFGVINKLLEALRITPIAFYQSPNLWRPILVLSEIWKTAGWGTILYLAALTSVNPELYEAIEVDGGGRWQKIRHVSVPTILPVFGILLILNSASLASGNFEQIYSLLGENILSSGSLLASKTEILEMYTYQVGLLQGSISFGAAVGFFQNVVAAILIFGTNALAGKMTSDRRFVLF